MLKKNKLLQKEIGIIISVLIVVCLSFASYFVFHNFLSKQDTILKKQRKTNDTAIVMRRFRDVGEIKACRHTISEDQCGKCFCIESNGRCDTIDTSIVGDLDGFLHQPLDYTYTRKQNEIDSSVTCPRTIKLYDINLHKSSNIE